ncbi:hypothetical protein AB6A40_009731 [Gnathostoma spinigerum]|uniref:Uncharacterized protein n=1 Tax=Gnathostoma spinigerum TaxID=75299 RepID=A0ABD6EV92_9BILA
MGPVQQKSSSSPSSPVHSSHEDDNHRKVSSFGAPPVRWRDVQHDVAESEHRDVAAENTSRFERNERRFYGDVDKVASDSELISSRKNLLKGKNLLPQEGSSAKKSQKPIRMDIDFSMPIQGVEIEHKQEKAKSAKPSTAFAVTFDSNTSSPVESISLQEAAAKNVGSRRGAPLLSAFSSTIFTIEPAEIKSDLVRVFRSDNFCNEDVCTQELIYI